MTKNIYIFSGLGANKKIFQRIDFSGHIATFIKYPVPYKKESIENYATRLLSQIKTENPTLIGLSFGGLMAIEVAKQIDTEKVIIIASAKTKYEIPFYYQFVGKLRINRLIPVRLLKQSNTVTRWFLGTTSPSDREILKYIIKNINPQFLKWAIDKVLHWTNTRQLQNIIHIHGLYDRILPYRFVNCDFTIKSGGHLVTLNNSNELNNFLKLLI